MVAVRKRRTQAQRRAATIERLIDASIDVLADSGYSGAGVKAICDRAGLSQGALFRHFDTRIDLLVATAEVIGERNIATFREFAATLRPETLDQQVEPLVALLRALSRSDLHAAWREVVAAGRTQPELGVAVSDAVGRMETAIIDTVTMHFEVTDDERMEIGTTVLSIVHMFDSEAVTTRVRPAPQIEARRLRWAQQVLRELLLGRRFVSRPRLVAEVAAADEVALEHEGAQR